ncbi:MAG: hypothetical protein BECKG1743D_GA0114223_104133 [Candidatus Kentron sp. G]|nr:MAG: hypothetical protein BECKG1743F_GA0114225_101853 [Candidatus Kentron sp. G]VFN01273.1 MAG: hypothetical protein BECKG1743E_GA0114224_103953 [Candidatus Kentron sp. G]VFN02942.1 MAG: hypothetical protein BECKG1743D_GA0114223_104133 [Candidatus Kentron sp. G]
MPPVMRTIEFQANIDKNGVIHLPQEYREAHGQQARFVMALPDKNPRDKKSIEGKTIDPMKYSNTVDWPIDGMDYQRQARSEWE